MDLDVHAWTLFTRGHCIDGPSCQGSRKIESNCTWNTLPANDVIVTSAWSIILEEEAKPDHEANSVAECYRR